MPTSDALAYTLYRFLNFAIPLYTISSEADYSKTKLPSFQETTEDLGPGAILLNIDNVGIVTV